MSRRMLIICCLFLLVLACDDNSEQSELPEYRYTSGDTTFLIPPEAVEFAGGRIASNYFNWDAYMLREYQVATNPSLRFPDPVFGGDINSWKGRPWQERRTFLVAPYDLDINTGNPAEFYYRIGTFTEQFGYGWIDTFDPEADLWNPAPHPWNSPADSTLTADRAATVEFDGESNLLLEYRSMWMIES